MVFSLTMEEMEFETKISCSLLKSQIMDFFFKVAESDILKDPLKSTRRMIQK